MKPLKNLSLCFLVALAASLSASAATITIDELDVRGTGIFGHNPNVTGVVYNNDPNNSPPGTLVSDPIDIQLTYNNLDLDGDATANDSVTFTLRASKFGGDGGALRAFGQGTDTGYGNLNDVEFSMFSVTGSTTDLGNPISFDGFTGAAIGGGVGAGNDLDASATINGNAASIFVADNGGFRFAVDAIDFAPTATVQFDNSTALNGSSIVARHFDLQFSATPAPPTPGTTIEFVSAEGYSDGALNGQQAWNAEGDWTVADSAGVGNVSTTTNSHIATLNAPVTLAAGEKYGFSINLEMLGNYVPEDPNLAGGFVYTFMAGVKEDSSSTSHGTGDADAADANIQIVRANDSYRLLNNFGTISGASGISGATLDGGDELVFDYELTLGSDPNGADTTFDVRLRNLTDGTDTGVGTVTGITSTLYTALTGGGGYAFFQTINPGADASGLTGVQVNSITVIPEPTSALLAGLGLLVVSRRKRKRT